MTAKQTKQNMKKNTPLIIIVYLCFFSCFISSSFANQFDINNNDSLIGNAENVISTNFNGGNGQKGFMFDVTFNNDVVIDSLTFNFWHFMTAPNTDYVVDLFIIDSTYIGNETDSLAWTLINTQTINSGNIVDPVTFMLNNSSVRFEMGDNKGLCLKIRGKTGSLAYSDIKYGEKEVYTDNNIIIKGGVGSDFSQVYPKRMPNISIFYQCSL